MAKIDRSIFKIEIKNAFSSILLVINPLIWYYAVIIFLENTIVELSAKGTLTGSESTLIWGAHFLGIIFAALIGAMLEKKIEKNLFLKLWISLGVFSSITLVTFDISSILNMTIIALFLGVSLGLGMPTCMGYYTDNVHIENRGRISGIMMLFTGIGLFLFSLFSPISPILLGIILACWRVSSLLGFCLFKPSTKEAQEKERCPYKNIVVQQSFILYLIPWIMLSLVNYLSTPTQMSLVGKDTLVFITIIQNIMIAVFAVIGGFLLDSVGRKRIAIAGFVMLGIDAATMGLFPDMLWANYFSATVDGIAWGFLLVIFIFTIWGDLSYGKNSSKYYALGVLPFFVSKFLEVTIGEIIAKTINPNASTLFSFLAFFLFVAILPLVYAPETLPERVMKSRDLNSYVDRAMKKLQKENEKIQKKAPKPEPSIENEPDSESEENSDEYEQARKLAEKYY
jgi:MFS family permease